MSRITKNISQYVKSKGFNLSKVSRETERCREMLWKRGGIDKVYHNWCTKLWTAREGGSVEDGK